jgi:hypothetical protein
LAFLQKAIQGRAMDAQIFRKLAYGNNFRFGMHRRVIPPARPNVVLYEFIQPMTKMVS